MGCRLVVKMVISLVACGGGRLGVMGSLIVLQLILHQRRVKCLFLGMKFQKEVEIAGV